MTVCFPNRQDRSAINHNAPRERHGVIVQHAFGRYPEAAFLDDPAEIEAIRRAG